MSKTLNLKVRHYRALPTDNPGYEEELLALPVDKTAFVGLHCWNIGCPDGPPIDTGYAAGMGWPEATMESWRIMRDVIRPAMDLCREIGIPVYHVEPDEFYVHYPDVESRRTPESDEFARTLRRRSDRWNIQRAGEFERIEARSGSENAQGSPVHRMKRAEIVSPQGDEPIVFYTSKLDEYLQVRGVDTIIYTGFATDMCILTSEGGGRPMVTAGYRCILMRDGTCGVESPDTFKEKLATRYGIFRFETAVGDSTTWEDFQTAVQGARD